MSEPPKHRPQLVEAGSLRPGPIRHEVLPDSFVVRARLAHAVLGAAAPVSLAEFLDAFRRDADPESELRIWERIALVTADLTRTRNVTDRERGSLVATLLFASTGVPASEMLSKANDLEPDLREAAASAARQLGFG